MVWWLQHQSNGETHQLVKGEDAAGNESCDQITLYIHQNIFFFIIWQRFHLLLQKLMTLYQVLLHALFNGCMEAGTPCPEAKRGRDARILALEVTFNTHQPSNSKTKQRNKVALIPLLPDELLVTTRRHMDNHSQCWRLPLGSRNVLSNPWPSTMCLGPTKPKRHALRASS